MYVTVTCGITCEEKHALHFCKGSLLIQVLFAFQCKHALGFFSAVYPDFLSQRMRVFRNRSVSEGSASPPPKYLWMFQVSRLILKLFQMISGVLLKYNREALIILFLFAVVEKVLLISIFTRHQGSMDPIMQNYLRLFKPDIGTGSQ